MAWLFSFPNPVNEKAARTVAAGVVVMAVCALVFQQPWLLIVLALGFLARVFTGPTLSPLGQFATRVVAPRLEPKLVPGPPKRFAQGIGAAFTCTAAVLYFGFGLPLAAYALVAVIALFAFMESALAFCAGCFVFNLLMRAGLIPASVCLECQNIWQRSGSAA